LADVTTQQSLQMAQDHLRAGRRAEADASYRDVLAREPQNAEALYYLGVITRRTGSSARWYNSCAG
jgi:Tfp pilus assembly protein PilF